MQDSTSSTGQGGGIPAQIQLEDFVEAVSRGVLRALQAGDDTAGYAIKPPALPSGGPLINRPLIFGWIIGPTGPWGQPGDFGGTLQRGELR